MSLATTGAFSRSFSKQFLVRAIVYKELVAFMKTIEIFRIWIAQVPEVLFFTDCVAISYLSTLKHSTSKMSSYASYLSGIPNLKVFHTSGNFGKYEKWKGKTHNFPSSIQGMTRAADLLSRSEIWQVISPATVPKEHLELLAQKTTNEVIPNNFIIQPHLLVSLTTQIKFSISSFPRLVPGRSDPSF